MGERFEVLGAKELAIGRASVYRVRHGGHETEQLASHTDVTAQLLNPRLHTNVAIGIFASHKEAEKAMVKEWQLRHAG